jgi:hypothetical protein
VANSFVCQSQTTHASVPKANLTRVSQAISPRTIARSQLPEALNFYTRFISARQVFIRGFCLNRERYSLF